MRVPCCRRIPSQHSVGASGQEPFEGRAKWSCAQNAFLVKYGYGRSSLSHLERKSGSAHRESGEEKILPRHKLIRGQSVMQNISREVAARCFEQLAGRPGRDLEIAAKEPASLYRYWCADNTFGTYCDERGLCALPASIETLRAYFEHIIDNGGSASNVAVHRAAITNKHRLHGHPIDWSPLRDLMQGIRRRHGQPRRQARPLRAQLLQAMRRRTRSGSGAGCQGRRSADAHLGRRTTPVRGRGPLLAAMRLPRQGLHPHEPSRSRDQDCAARRRRRGPRT